MAPVDVPAAFLSHVKGCKHTTLNKVIWLCAKDVTRALGYEEPTAARRAHVLASSKRRLGDLLQQGCEIGLLSGFSVSKRSAQSLFIDETGLKSLIAGSRQPMALKFMQLAGLETLNRIKLPTTEQEIMYALRKAFAGREFRLQQRVLLGCTG